MRARTSAWADALWRSPGDCVAEVTALSPGGGGERRSTWLRGSHCGGLETPPHAAAHPPSRGGLLRAEGSGEAALPGSDGERQCDPAPHAPLLRLPPPPRPQLLASPAPRRSAQWRRRRRERVADPRRSLDDAARASTSRSFPRQVKTESGGGGGGRQATGPGEKGDSEEKRSVCVGSRERGAPEEGPRRATSYAEPGQARAGRRAEGE